MRTVFWALFWIYSAAYLSFASYTFWKNLMILTQAPFKVKWVIFIFKKWSMSRSVRKFLQRAQAMARNPGSDKSSERSRLPPAP